MSLKKLFDSLFEVPIMGTYLMIFCLIFILTVFGDMGVGITEPPENIDQKNIHTRVGSAVRSILLILPKSDEGE